jgi:hypothetical protein
MRRDRRRVLLVTAAGKPQPYARRAVEVSAGLPAGAYVVTVEHDGDCRIFRGQPCTCSPTVRSPRPAPV